MNHKKVLVLTGARLVAPHVLPADAQPSRRKQKSYAQAAAAPAQTPSKKYTSRDALLDAWVERHAARQAAAAAAETDGWSPAASSSNVTLGDFGPKNDLVPASEETEPVRTQPFPPQGDAPATTLPVDTPAQAPKVTYAQVYAYLTDAQKKALEKAGYRWEFVSKEGLRCLSKTHLEIDHIVPRSCGGEGTISNVRVLCRGHNLRKAEHDMGELFIRNRIANVRKERTLIDSSGAPRFPDQR